MARLVLYLLGGFNATVDDEPLTGIYDHVRALLAYIASESDRAHRREVLAELLWPDESEEVARRNLRQALSRLRAALGDRDSDNPFLLIDRATIQFNQNSDHYLDVAAFAAAKPVKENEISAADVPWLEEAVRLYRGHYLNQFYLPDNPGFDQWASSRSEDYKRRALSYLRALGGYHESVGDLSKAIETARRQIELEPWHEIAHRHLMQLLAKSGQRSAALAQYNACRALLLEELGVEPEPETEALRQAILEGQIEANSAPGTASPSSSGRRQVTVLYCGLAEPAGVDPEDFIEVVRAFKQRCGEIAARFEAHVEDAHGGAQILFFGFPQAHEDDAQRALHAALRVLSETRELSAQEGLPLVIRGGVHTGLMVTAGGDTADLPVDLIGTPLGVAVQLRYQAQANSFLISADTERLTRGYFLVKEQVLAASPELAHALPAHQLQRAAQARARIEAARMGKLSPFVGREVELADLVEYWGHVRTGQGRVALVEGEPGMGKSRFLHVFKRRLLRESHTIRQLRCTPDYQTTGVQPVAELVQQMCDFRSSDPQETRNAKIAGTLERLGLDATQNLPYLAHLLGLPAGAELANTSINPQQIKQRTLGLIADMLRVSSQARPLLFVVEDLHWVDPTTLELLKLLRKDIGKHPIMLLATLRPGYEHPFERGSVRIQLNPLPAAEVRRLAVGVARNKALPEIVLKQIVDRTDGVPLFIEELTKTLLESNLLKETHSRFELASASPTVALPFTLHDSLMARLDRLDSAKHIAQLGAVLGREFRYEALRDLAECEEKSLQNELSRLVDAELLYQRQEDGLTLYGFRHVMIQEVAYESLLRRHRQELHRQVAHQLEEGREHGESVNPELLAHHFQEGGLARKAVQYWYQAGLQASQLSAHTEAVDYLRRGLALLKELPEDTERDHSELALCMAMGVPLMLSAGPVPEIEQAYGRALELSQQMPESQDLFPAVRGLYTYYAGLADYHTAERLAQQLLRIAEEQNNDALSLEAHRALGTTFLMRGELRDAQHHLEMALRLYDPSRHRALAQPYGMDPGVAAFSLLSVCDWIAGYPQRAQHRALDAVALAEENNHASTLGWALNVALTVMQLSRESEQILKLTAVLGRLAERHHMPLWGLWSGLLRDGALIALGREPETENDIHEDFVRYDAVCAGMGRPYLLTLWADTCLITGQFDRGLQVVQEALAWIAKHAARLQEPELHRLEGELLLASQRDPSGKQAEAAFQRALALARAQGARAFELRAGLSLCRLYAQHGRDSRGPDLLEEILAEFPQEQESRELREARALLKSARRLANST